MEQYIITRINYDDYKEKILSISYLAYDKFNQNENCYPEKEINQTISYQDFLTQIENSQNVFYGSLITIESNDGSNIKVKEKRYNGIEIEKITKDNVDDVLRTFKNLY